MASAQLRSGVLALFSAVTATLLPTPALADQVRGQVLVTQGHEASQCRMVLLRRADDGSTMWFRIPAGNNDILAVTMTALASRLNVEIFYTPGVTSGCGTEPRIQHISLLSDGA